MGLIISHSFHYAEYKFGGQIGLSRQNFEKIEVKCVKKKKIILVIFVTRLN